MGFDVEGSVGGNLDKARRTPRPLAGRAIERKCALPGTPRGALRGGALRGVVRRTGEEGSCRLRARTGGVACAGLYGACALSRGNVGGRRQAAGAATAAEAAATAAAGREQVEERSMALYVQYCRQGDKGRCALGAAHKQRSSFTHVSLLPTNQPPHTASCARRHSCPHLLSSLTKCTPSGALTCSSHLLLWLQRRR